MNQTYQEFLEESTNTVKAKRNLGQIILLSTYFVIWIVAMTIFWKYPNPVALEFETIIRWIILPFLLLVSTIIVAKNDYWGKGNWLCVIGAGVTFLTVPYTEYIEDAGGIVTLVFQYPNFMYMAVGIGVSVLGIGMGMLWKRK